VIKTLRFRDGRASLRENVLGQLRRGTITERAVTTRGGESVDVDLVTWGRTQGPKGQSTKVMVLSLGIKKDVREGQSRRRT